MAARLRPGRRRTQPTSRAPKSIWPSGRRPQSGKLIATWMTVVVGRFQIEPFPVPSWIELSSEDRLRPKTIQLAREVRAFTALRAFIGVRSCGCKGL